MGRRSKASLGHWVELTAKHVALGSGCGRGPGPLSCQPVGLLLGLPQGGGTVGDGSPQGVAGMPAPLWAQVLGSARAGLTGQGHVKDRRAGAHLRRGMVVVSVVVPFPLPAGFPTGLLRVRDDKTFWTRPSLV